MCDNWDILKNLWGGSRATTSIQNSIHSFTTESEKEGPMLEHENEEDEGEAEKNNASDTLNGGVDPLSSNSTKISLTIREN